MYTPASANVWKSQIRSACRQLLGNTGGPVWPSQPLSVDIQFWLPAGTSRWFTSTPDLDNLEKAVLDAITQCGLVWHDDAQVVQLRSSKVGVRSNRAGCRIRVALAPPLSLD